MVTIKVSRKLINFLNDFAKIVDSDKCRKFTECLRNGKSEDGSFSDLLIECLRDVEVKYRKLQELTSPFVLEELEGSKIIKCFDKCSEVLKEYSKRIRAVEKTYGIVLRAITTHGDSKIGKDQTPDIVKRLCRHLEIDKNLAIVHIIRFGLVKAMLKDYIKCLTKLCGIEEIKSLYNELIENIQKRSNLSDEDIKFVLDSLREWCIENKICS